MKKILNLLFIACLIIILGCSANPPSENTQNQNSPGSNLPSQNQPQVTGSNNSPSYKNMAGTYRCWSYNVAGAGKSCTSPPIILKEDNTYLMSSEQGTYTIEGNTINLSESKIRGLGKIIDSNKIRFEYDYNSFHTTVTYLKTDEKTNGAEQKIKESNQQYIAVSLNILFPESERISSINTASLISKDETGTVSESIAYISKPHTITALFRKGGTKIGILTGKIYTVKVSSGFGGWSVGEINLMNITKDVTLNINAETNSDKTIANTSIEQTTAQQATISSPPVIPSSPNISSQIPANAVKCNPNIPKYSQSGCIE